MNKTIGAIAVVLLLNAPAQAQVNSCVFGSTTNVTTNMVGAPLTTSVSEPMTGWPYVCIGEEISVTASPTTGLPGLAEIVTTNEDCAITDTIIPLPSSAIVSTWWQANGDPFSGGGSGPTATFTPTACGTGTIEFYLQYNQALPLGGQNTVSITNSYTAIGVAALAPSNCSACYQTDSNSTLQIYTIPVSTNLSVTNIAIAATPCPSVSNANLPECWSLDGVRTNVTYVAITNPGVYTVICTSGTSAVTNIICVLESGDVEQACPTNVSSLLGYWSFNSSIVDWWPANSNANDAVGTNNGTTTNVTYTNGILGDGFYFSGSNSYISFGTNTGNFGTNNFTIDFWMETSVAVQEAVLEKRPTCSWGNMWDVVMLSSGKLRFEIAQDTNGTSDCYNTTLDTMAHVNDGNFHEVTITRVGLTLTTYIDGTWDNTTNAVAVANIHNNTAMTAGNNPCVGVDGTHYFEGVLDEIKFGNGLISPWVGNRDQQPVASYGLQNPASPWGSALQIDTTNVANLSYPYMEDNGIGNLNCINGAVSFYFKPDWNGGTGASTNSAGQLIEVGSPYIYGNPFWWSLAVDPTESNLIFQSGSNGTTTTYFTQPITNWISSNWYQIVLDYSSNQTSLYTNGALAVTGPGMTNYPDISTRLAYGLSIGSDVLGGEQMRGTMDELMTFNCPLSASNIASSYGSNITWTNWAMTPSVVLQPEAASGLIVCVGSTLTGGVGWSNVPGLLIGWTTGASGTRGYLTQTVFPTVLTNWNAVSWSGGSVTNASSSFAMTNAGFWTNIFYLTYTNPAPWATATTVSWTNIFTVVGVASLAPTNSTACVLLSNTSPPIYSVPVCTNAGATNLELIAAPYPAVAATNLPGCWSLAGAATNIMEINIAEPGAYTVVCSSGTSSQTNLILVTPAQATATNTNSSPLLAYWPFNPTALDWWPGQSDANDIAGTNNGTLNNVTFTNGILGDAFYFNGTNSYISFGTNAGNFGTNNFTIDFWVETTGTAEMDILSKRSICNWTNMWDVMMLSGGTLRFVIAQDLISQTDCYDTTLNSNGRINDGNFHEVTVTRSGLSLTLYIDGNFDCNVTAVAIANIQNSTVTKAGDNPCVGVNGTQYFQGVLDEIKLIGSGGNPWIGNEGQAPLTNYCLQNPASPWTNALQVDSNTAANLTYQYSESDGIKNINCTNGAVSFWLMPDWNGGVGPGTNGQLLMFGDGTNSLWSLNVDATGSNLVFQTASNAVFTAYFTNVITNFSSNIYNAVTLDYSTTATALYLNGLPVQTGPGIATYPNNADCANYGFSVGSDHLGQHQARACFDELYTYNSPLSSSQILANYVDGLLTANVSGGGSGNGQPNWNTYNSLNGITNGGGIQVFTPMH